jgi:hypothetical protein
MKGPLVTRRALPAAAAAVAAAALITLAVGCGSDQQVLTLTQEPAPVKEVAINTDPNGDPGDQFVFEGPVLKDGKAYGVMLGTITKEFAHMKTWHPKSEERLVTAVFDLPGGQISVLGASSYAPGASEGDFTSETRAVVGGTGTYLNAHGEVTTTYNKSANLYTHVITYSTD